MRILLSAGEVSGDIAGARLARELLARREDLSLFGLGGRRMTEAGVEILRDTNTLGTVGISESFRVVPSLARAFASLRRRVIRTPPDAAVLIANDIFHVILGRWLRSRGIPTLSYFPPQVWVWRSVIGAFAPSFDEILTSFPEEERVWQAAGASTTFVGHYLGDVLRPASEDDRRHARKTLGLTDGPVVALLPGSRPFEVKRLGPILLDAARLLRDRDPRIRFVLPFADPAFAPRIEAEVARRGLKDAVVAAPGSYDALRAADFAIVASGTASLEAALLGTPMVIAYRLGTLTIGIVQSAIALRLLESDTVGLPNLVLGRRAIPERIQRQVTGAELAAVAARLLADDVLRQKQRQALAEVSRLLFGGGSDARAAEAVLAAAERRPAQVRAFGGTVAARERSVP